MNKKIIGNFGESFAKKYLEKKGYTILETNWRFNHKELDIIAYKNGLICFEVKTRSTDSNPAWTILKINQVGRLRLSLQAYCQLKHFDYNLSQLDLLVITIKDKITITVKHYPNI